MSVLAGVVKEPSAYGWTPVIPAPSYFVWLSPLSEDFEGFRLDEGLASCLPDETCWEMEILEHGVFTYTRLHPGNSHVDQERFNRAILENDPDECAKGLQGLVGMTSNPSAFLTEGRQFSMSLTKHVIDVEGGFATVELDEKNDFADVCRWLTKKAPV